MLIEGVLFVGKSCLGRAGSTEEASMLRGWKANHIRLSFVLSELFPLPVYPHLPAGSVCAEMREAAAIAL